MAPASRLASTSAEHRGAALPMRAVCERPEPPTAGVRRPDSEPSKCAGAWDLDPPPLRSRPVETLEQIADRIAPVNEASDRRAMPARARELAPREAPKVEPEHEAWLPPYTDEPYRSRFGNHDWLIDTGPG
jgi:hypothetical protein